MATMTAHRSLGFAHSRQNSQASAASGSSYQLILEHILAYPGTYEIPLRTMYTLNCAPRAQSGSNNNSRAPSPSSSKSNSPTSPFFQQYDPHLATVQFTAALMEQISRLPSQPASLPASFVTSFVNKCFPIELEFVDFPQSLTALDYLKDLEMRRRRDIAQCFQNLELDQSHLSADTMDQLRDWNPTVSSWIETLEPKLKRVEALYTQLYISLRRWILINEMCLQPFNKNNCLAMLNTLYPPVMSSQPTTRLTIPTIMTQRQGFFKYIQTVEKRGIGCLETLMKQGRKEGEVNGWPAVRRLVSQYLALANTVINECWEMHSLKVNAPTPFEVTTALPTIPRVEQGQNTRSGRKVDSGISFGSQGSHSKSNSTSSTAGKSTVSQYTMASEPIGKSGTALERLAREFRKMRPKQKSFNDIDQLQSPYYPINQEDMTPALRSPPSLPKTKGMNTLRKMKSLGSIGDLKHQNSSTSSIMGFSRTATPTFDSREMKRQREAFEKRVADIS